MKRNPVSIGWSPPLVDCMRYSAPGMVVAFSDDATPAQGQPFNLRRVVTSEPVKTASAIALTFHGYRRTGSIVWALLYGLAGRVVPVAAVPIALAQGFGQRKACP